MGKKDTERRVYTKDFKAGAVTLEESASGGRFRLTLNRELGPDILSLISPEVTDYLSALMAPIATGEALSRAEYLELAASVYGKPIADEIAGASIRASVDFPGQLRSVQGGDLPAGGPNLTSPFWISWFWKVPWSTRPPGVNKNCAGESRKEQANPWPPKLSTTCFWSG